MDYVVILFLQVVISIATLALISFGLAIVFGMMRIINLAHGEFLMLGGYAAVIATHQGVNLWLAIFVVAPIVVGVLGFFIERLVIRRLYDRMLDTMLATWGISLMLIGAVTVIFGTNMSGIAMPLGSIPIGRFSIGAYNLLIVGVVVALLLLTWLALCKTDFGLIARGAMQNRQMAAALGIDPGKTYAITFVIGAAVTGLAGALLAPITGVAPTMGALYIAKAFITVISGGAAMLTGTATASTLLGGIDTGVSFAFNPVLGDVALLVAAVILLRLLPQGITGRFFRRAL